MQAHIHTHIIYVRIHVCRCRYTRACVCDAHQIDITLKCMTTCTRRVMRFNAADSYAKHVLLLVTRTNIPWNWSSTDPFLQMRACASIDMQTTQFPFMNNMGWKTMLLRWAQLSASEQGFSTPSVSWRVTQIIPWAKQTLQRRTNLPQGCHRFVEMNGATKW